MSEYGSKRPGGVNAIINDERYRSVFYQVVVFGLFIYAGVEVIASGMEDGFAERLGVATLGVFFLIGLILLRRLNKFKSLEPTVEDTELIDG